MVRVVAHRMGNILSTWKSLAITVHFNLQGKKRKKKKTNLEGLSLKNSGLRKVRYLDHRYSRGVDPNLGSREPRALTILSLKQSIWVLPTYPGQAGGRVHFHRTGSLPTHGLGVSGFLFLTSGLSLCPRAYFYLCSFYTFAW